jgi:transketolase
MIPEHAQLDPHLFDASLSQAPIRKGFGEGLLAAGKQDSRIVGLCADLTESTQMHLFAEAFPERFIEIGVAEQNLVAVASGMAAMGKIPFVSSYAVFSPGRNWEQIRTTVCYNNQPVKIVGSHAGVSVGPDGGSHQALEDIAITRVLPRMVVLSPCDAIEARKATLAAAGNGTPVYLRLAREKTPIFTTPATPFEIGKAQIFWQPASGAPDVALFATGALVYKALVVARTLERDEKIAVTVVNVSTIKPLDEKTVIAVARQAKAIVTIEEHQIVGGLGSAIAECLSRTVPVPQEYIGVHDMFGQSGKPDELIAHYKMDEKAIHQAVLKVLKRKVQ